MKRGDFIQHEKYGKAVVMEVSLSTFRAMCEIGGEKEFVIDSNSYKIINESDSNDDSANDNRYELKEFEKLVINTIEKNLGIINPIFIADKWKGGKLILQPLNNNLQSKEIEISTLFNKIIMIRERLRVLEQNINNNDKLDDNDKLHIQQYISRCYGSLTTFNIMFRDKEDHFTSK